MKKSIIFTLILAIILSSAAFAGCGEKASWSVVNDIQITDVPNLNIEAFYNEKYGIILGSNPDEAWYTNDGGKTWTQAPGAYSFRYSIDIVNDKLAWNVGDGDEICFTSDGGETWHPVTEFVVPGIQSQVDFVDDKTGWIASQTAIAATNDGGSTWYRVKLPEDVRSVAALCLRTGDDGYILSHKGEFCTTKDGGKTWDVKDLGFEDLNIVDLNNVKGRLMYVNTAVADISFTDEKHGTIVIIGVVVNEGYKTWTYTTSDGGANWAIEELKAVDGFSPSSVFMTSDGKYITLSSVKKRLIVLKRR